MPDAPSRLEIRLADMRFHVRVGILPHERVLAQPLEIDLTVRRAPGTADVLDYRTLYTVVSEAVSAEPLDYLETLADAIAKGVTSLNGVAWVRVAVRKPHVALGGPLAFAEVAVERGA